MKIIRIILILALAGILINLSAISQDKARVHRGDFKLKPDGFKEAWKAVKKGNKDYSFGPASYRSARVNYLKAYKYNDKNAELNYKIGVCYLYSDDKFEAIKYFKKAFELKPKVTSDIHFQLARAYHMSLDFDNAIKEYNQYKESVSPRKLEKKNIDINQYISDCGTGKELVSHPVRVVVQNLGKEVNSEYDDYYPVIDSKEQTIYFTSRRPSKMNKKRNFLDKKFEENIYVAKKKDKDWGIAQILSKKFTGKKNNAAVGLSPDDNKLYIYKSSGGGDIYYTEMKEGSWKRPKSLSRINSRAQETSMSITGDGKKLYFVSDREKNSIGGKDIYYCDLNAKGKWSKPKNIGVPINTPENEEAVSVTKDGKTLYFSSKGHPGMGGYDIFMSTYGDNGKWSKPVNLGYPVNTPDDDLFFTMMGNGKIAYMSSNREQGMGGKDIYKVVFLGAEKEMSMTTENSPLAFETYDSVTLFRKPPEFYTIDTSILLHGRVLDSETKGPILAKLQFIDSEKSNIIGILISDSTGNYKMHLPEKKSYGVEITAKGYLFFLDAIDLKKENKDVVKKDFVLQKLEVGAKVVLKNIFFETGKSDLKEESFQQLDIVTGFMKENPTLKLEISGHTDNVGSLSSNLKLSEARAKSVVDYLVNKGIDKSRLTFKGYGPNQPVALNNTNTGRALNRRVEFKITGK